MHRSGVCRFGIATARVRSRFRSTAVVELMDGTRVAISTAAVLPWIVAFKAIKSLLLVVFGIGLLFSIGVVTADVKLLIRES